MMDIITVIRNATDLIASHNNGTERKHTMFISRLLKCISQHSPAASLPTRIMAFIKDLNTMTEKAVALPGYESVADSLLQQTLYNFLPPRTPKDQYIADLRKKLGIRPISGNIYYNLSVMVTHAITFRVNYSWTLRMWQGKLTYINSSRYMNVNIIYV
jgi:hypothetical protein